MRRLSPDELRKLKDKAAEAAARGKLDKAADHYREAAGADPKDIGTRQRLAEVLRRAGRIPEAVEAYRDVAARFGADGLLIKAIAISKTILELDPEHVETQTALAELYAQRAAAEGARPPPRTMVMQAMKAVATPAAPPAAGVPVPAARTGQPPPAPDAREDGVVAIPLGPPPGIEPEPEAVPIEVLIEPEPEAGPVPPPAPPRPHVARPQASLEPPVRPTADDEPPTPFARICLVAREAVAAGIDEDLLVEADPVDVEVVGDEPLALASAGSGEVAGDEPAPEPGTEEIAIEAPPDPVRAPAAPAARPPPLRAPPAGAPSPHPAAPPRLAPARGAPPAASRPPPPPPPAALPRVPIFSDLSRDAFLALANGMVLHRVPRGEAVLREGDDGTSFYVVASGSFAVAKRDDSGASVVLARLGEGDFFGEMALLSGARRSATVTAEQDGEVLEFRADVLLGIARRHPHVARSLRRFYRQRLLANAMAVSPIFRPFQRADRKALVERFRARDVVAGEVIIREGQPSDGLYVVLEGAVDVRKRQDAQEIAVGHLREGDLFGEMSCLRKAPATASVVVARPGTLLRLPRRDFDDLVVTHPQILELVATLSEERAESLDAILSGHAQWTEDGLVLT